MSKLDNWLQSTVTIGTKKKVKKEVKKEEKEKLNLYMRTLVYIKDLEDQAKDEKDETKLKELRQTIHNERETASKMYATRGDIIKGAIIAGGSLLGVVLSIVIPLAIYLGLSQRESDPNDTSYMDQAHNKYSALNFLVQKLKKII